LSQIKYLYPDAWINIRSKKEIQLLSKYLQKPDKIKKAVLPRTSIPLTKPIGVRTPSLGQGEKSNEEFAEELLKEAHEKFIDQDYSRVLAITTKVREIGSLDQKQAALELTGLVRERQNKLAQAISIYSEFLDLYPDSKMAPKIQNRLQGLKTMRSEPKQRLSQTTMQSGPEWYFSGFLSQYYQNDVLEIDTLDSEEVRNALLTNLNLFARRKSATSSLELRFDGSLINNFLDKSDKGRTSRAMVNYINEESDYQLIAGRQSRTVKGVSGRFDGFVYKGLSSTSFDYSLFTGYPVQSAYDGYDPERQFFGTGIHFQAGTGFGMDFYLVQQDNSGLTDRQAFGTEFQYRSEDGFVYGIVDYDIFYDDLNNVTLIGNYRSSEKLSFNLTMDYKNAPYLTTLNAIQGQSVDSIDELLDIYTEDEIYKLAEDRTSKSSYLLFGASYQLDSDHQIYLSMSMAQTDATQTSGGVEATPDSDDTYLSGDYSIRSFFVDQDFTTFGLRLADSSSAETMSLRGRTLIPGSIRSLRYGPKLHIDYRKSKTTDLNQYILYPSFKITYKPSRTVSLEFNTGVEYSNFDLPDRNDQILYNLYLGYVYQF
jgi:hypothetical protein